MKHSEINLLALFDKGCKILHEEYKDVELSKRGNLRAGDSGALLPDGSVVGQCHRKAFARWIGQPSRQPSPIAQSNFDTGYSNEDNWLAKLKLAWNGPILCEDEIPILWKASGVQVSGRPDMVLCSQDFEPLLILEHKAIISLSKAAGVWLGEVDPKHFLQACHYSMALGCPATIVYTFSGLGMLPWFVKKVDREKFWPKGKGWEVKPFKKEFRIGREGEQYYYVVDGKKTVTKITQKSIRDFYDLQVDMQAQKSLYKRHSSKDLQGEPMRFNSCDYCDLRSACDEYEGDFDRWVDEVQKGVTDE